MENLNGAKVAILVTDGFEHVELTEPRKALDQAGAKTSIVSPKKDRVRSWKFTEWGEHFPVDLPLENAKSEDFDALLLPGGVINPDSLRIDESAVQFVRSFFDANITFAESCINPPTALTFRVSVFSAKGSSASHPYTNTGVASATRELRRLSFRSGVRLSRRRRLDRRCVTTNGSNP